MRTLTHQSIEMRVFKLLLLLLLPVLAFGQRPKVDYIQFDSLTTAQRDALTIDTTRVALLYNRTASQWQYKVGKGAWTALTSGGAGISWGDPVDSNIIPGADNTYDLGSGAASFNDAWIDGNLTLGGLSSNLLPSADATYNLGSIGQSFNNLYLDGTAFISGPLSSTGDISVNLDTDNNSANVFEIKDGAGTQVWRVDESGDMFTTVGDITAVNLTLTGTATGNFVGDGDKGDITVSGSGATWGIDSGVINVDKLESTNAATDGYFPSYDSATGGVTWEAISTTDSGSGYSFNSVATDNIYIRNAQVTNGGDATGRKIWNQFTVTADSVWLHKDSVALTGNPFILQPWGADSVVVRKGAGTNFFIADSAAALSADGIVIKGRHPITAIKTAATDFFLQGNFTTYTVPSGPVNLYSNSDAANPVSEANSAAGWTVDIGTDLGVTVNSSDFQDGLYSLEFTHNGTNSTQQTMVVDITGLTIGATYSVTFDAKEVTSGAFEVWLRLSQGWVANAGTAIGTTWTEYTLTGEATATTAQIRVGTNTTGQNGQKLLLDNIRVVAQ